MSEKLKPYEADRLRTAYRDEYKRVTLSPAKPFNSKEMRYENNNMLLFSGEAALLLKKNGLLIDSDFQDFVDAFKCCEISPGLYQRHPLPYGELHPIIKRDVVSHDEYNGVMYVCAAFPEMRDTLAVDVCNYGDENGQEFNDNYPNTSYAKELAKDFKGVLTKTFKMIKMMINGEEYRDKVGIAENLTYKRQLRDTCLYRIISSNDSPGLIETLYRALSVVMATRKPVDYKSNSGRMMHLYSMWAIEEVGHKGLILKLAHKYFRKKCKEQFGENYVEELHRRYFKRDKEHPFHGLCIGLK